MRVEEYTAHRPTMLAAAYRITGSRHDAEDVVQDTWLRCRDLDLGTIDAPGRYLAVAAARGALNARRAQQRRRETYVGPWLPDPVVDDRGPDWAVLHHEGLGQALDVVLSAMSPEQATAFVLRVVLDVDYPTIADVLDTTVAAARQAVSRARRAVAGRDLPDQPDRDLAALAALAEAVVQGNVDAVVALLAADSVVHTDGGGKVTAARHPVRGRDKVARFLLGLRQTSTTTDTRFSMATVNGGPGLLVHEDDALTTVITLHSGDHGVEELYFSRNPDKLLDTPPQSPRP